MPHTFLADMYSEHDTMRGDIWSILQQEDVVLSTEQEIMTLVDHCLDVFVACDLQLPVDLAAKLTTCKCPLDEFFEYAFATIAPEGTELFYELTDPKRKH